MFKCNLIQAVQAEIRSTIKMHSFKKLFCSIPFSTCLHFFLLPLQEFLENGPPPERQELEDYGEHFKL